MTSRFIRTTAMQARRRFLALVFILASPRGAWAQTDVWSGPVTVRQYLDIYGYCRFVGNFGELDYKGASRGTSGLIGGLL